MNGKHLFKTLGNCSVYDKCPGTPQFKDQYIMTIKQCTMQTSNNSPMISLLHSPDLFEARLLFIMTPPTIMRMAAMTIGIPTPVIPAKP